MLTGIPPPKTRHKVQYRITHKEQKVAVHQITRQHVNFPSASVPSARCRSTFPPRSPSWCHPALKHAPRVAKQSKHPQPPGVFQHKWDGKTWKNSWLRRSSSRRRSIPGLEAAIRAFCSMVGFMVMRPSRMLSLSSWDWDGRVGLRKDPMKSTFWSLARLGTYFTWDASSLKVSGFHMLPPTGMLNLSTSWPLCLTSLCLVQKGSTYIIMWLGC